MCKLNSGTQVIFFVFTIVLVEYTGLFLLNTGEQIRQSLFISLVYHTPIRFFVSTSFL
jgi:hypothetical protein